ncbi:MAG: BamA/TamA family outer membrane protein, partial [Steroidobacteraceae bacterium]
ALDPRALAARVISIALIALTAAGAPALAATPGAGSGGPAARHSLTPAESTQPPASAREKPATGLARWLNPATAPFIPVPEIDEDPYSGTTVGLIPAFLTTNSRNEISRIYAPDVIYNQYFGYGARARVFDYPSDNTQWSIVGGGKQRVESQFDGEYAAGILRQDLWSFNFSVVYDRNGSPHFYGIGNGTPVYRQTNYTEQQKYIQLTVGLNLTHVWQLGYTFRARAVEITPGHLPGVPSIQALYPQTSLFSERQEILNRLFVDYDTRDSVVAPTRGAEWVAYAGGASAEGMLNATLYSEVGIDGRNFWSLPGAAVLAVHVSLRYMPRTERTRNIPFWALSRIGGDEADIGGDQILRGFGSGRFVDRNSTSINIEYRKHITTFDAFANGVAIELAPFVDFGEVFHNMSDDPVGQLHKVAGLGVRGLALPFVVAYVDVGYGDEGAAIFTGLNYPF